MVLALDHVLRAAPVEAEDFVIEVAARENPPSRFLAKGERILKERSRLT